MKVAIIGYGKMGQEIEHTLYERGHEIGLIIDVDNRIELTSKKLAGIDVAIEFTTPETAPENILNCFQAGIPVVCGSTGWLTQLNAIRNKCLDYKTAFFYASNYSLGVNLFFKLNQYLAKMMNRVDSYQVSIEEIHHTAKKDAPSGTAITLAEDILSEYTSLNTWSLVPSVKENELPIKSIRRDPFPGMHSILYSSEVDSISISHEAKNRKGFALGAVFAAEFLKGKQGNFGMSDLLKWD
ncbi:MAG: 4-hydroxy-tetrahydrodipicolinate reductase [Bacteroidales bacterium]